jgi:hypothetical protein
MAGTVKFIGQLGISEHIAGSSGRHPVLCSRHVAKGWIPLTVLSILLFIDLHMY